MSTQGKWRMQQRVLGKTDWRITSKSHPSALSHRVATVGTKNNATLIVTAVNACTEIDPNNPQAVADDIKWMYKLAEETAGPFMSVPKYLASRYGE